MGWLTLSDVELSDALRGSSILMSWAILELGSVGIDPDRVGRGPLPKMLSALARIRPRSRSSSPPDAKIFLLLRVRCIRQTASHTYPLILSCPDASCSS